MPALSKHVMSTTEVRLQRFIGGVLTGMGPADAYMHAGYKPKSRHVARAAGSRMLARVDVQARLTAARELAHKADVLTLQQKREFLKRVVATPVGVVSENDPLCGKMKRSVHHTADSLVETVSVEMPDKLRALELDAKLAGELKGGALASSETTAEAFTISPEAERRIAKVLETMMAMPRGLALIHQKVQPKATPACPAPSKLEELALKIAHAASRKSSSSAAVRPCFR